MIEGSMRYTDGKVIEYDEGIKMGSTDGKVFGTILGNVYRITLGIDIGTKLGILDVSFDDSNKGKLEGLLLGDSLGYTDVKLIGFDGGTS